MREILFRGKRTDNGEWVEGYYIHRPSAVGIGNSNPICIWIPAADPDDSTKIFEVSTETVCQFTGIYDKNGRKIFEGDIIEITDTFNKIISGVVYWCDCSFWVDCSHPDDDDGFYSLGHLGDCVEVIGNIYDNPVLLEGRDEIL